MTAPRIDVHLAGGGTLYLFLLETPEAQTWVEENVSEDRLMLGNGLAVEWRYAAALAAGMENDGLVIGGTEVQQ